MVRKIIIDCHNTFSIDDCDIDDGLAIIYTLAQEDTEVLGINTTFGNNKVDIVYSNTISFMKNIGYSQIPEIKDIDEYIEHVYEQYKIFGEKY